MPYYVDREKAYAAGDPYAKLFMVRVELEPFNGWVLVLTPKSKRSFDVPLSDLLAVAEVDLAGWPRLRERPRNTRPVPINDAKLPDVTPTWKAGDARPW